MKTGITFYIGQKDYFIQTNQKNRTIPFAIRVLKNLGIAPTNANAKELVNRMKRATFEKVETENGFQYYRISGDGFTSCNPVQDNCTVIMALY